MRQIELHFRDACAMLGIDHELVTMNLRRRGRHDINARERAAIADWMATHRMPAYMRVATHGEIASVLKMTRMSVCDAVRRHRARANRESVAPASRRVVA